MRLEERYYSKKKWPVTVICDKVHFLFVEFVAACFFVFLSEAEVIFRTVTDVEGIFSFFNKDTVFSC